MAEIEANTINVYMRCNECGITVCFEKVIDDRFDLKFNVQPCEKCLEAEFERGYEWA